mmetsp:Transcript_5118/g.13714  ORF Transcript_5118/g.13714 Transcript_5118/m.13714 type:complete len:430 (+) Transcript_5118:1958-3247(+)
MPAQEEANVAENDQRHRDAQPQRQDGTREERVCGFVQLVVHVTLSALHAKDAIDFALREGAQPSSVPPSHDAPDGAHEESYDCDKRQTCCTDGQKERRVGLSRLDFESLVGDLAEVLFVCWQVRAFHHGVVQHPVDLQREVVTAKKAFDVVDEFVSNLGHAFPCFWRRQEVGQFVHFRAGTFDAGDVQSQLGRRCGEIDELYIGDLVWKPHTPFVELGCWDDRQPAVPVQEALQWERTESLISNAEQALDEDACCVQVQLEIDFVAHLQVVIAENREQQPRGEAERPVLGREHARIVQLERRAHHRLKDGHWVPERVQVLNSHVADPKFDRRIEAAGLDTGFRIEEASFERECSGRVGLVLQQWPDHDSIGLGETCLFVDVKYEVLDKLKDRAEEIPVLALASRGHGFCVIGLEEEIAEINECIHACLQ